MSHQLPELPEPAQQQQYVCTKCGKTGHGPGEWHDRLDGSPCGYMALHHGPWFTVDQMRAYAELCIASVKREPLSEERIESIYMQWEDTPATFADLFRAIEHAHGIAGGAENDHDGPESRASADTQGVHKVQESLPSALPIPAQDPQWLPIETAPKDGTEVLLRSRKGRIANGLYRAANSETGFWAWAYVKQEPFEWMPLPPPPVDKHSLTADSREDA